ncbi:unnamed protein product [Sphagnum compactum]
MLGISSLLSSALTTPTPILLSLPSLKSRANSQGCTVIKRNLKTEMRRFRTPFRLRTWTVVVQMRWNAKKSERCDRHSANSCSNRPCLIQILDNSDNGHLFSRPLKKLARDESFSIGVARGKAEKLLAMEEEEGSCKQEEFYSVEEPEGEGVGGGQEGKAAAIALRNEGTERCAITITAKSSAEEQYVHNLMHGSVDMLKLPEGATLLAGTEGLLINSDADGFDVLSYMRRLDTLQFGKLLLYAHQLPSTHTLLSQNFHAFPVGTVSVADVQKQGKGRGGNKWESPKGCLMFSYTLQMEDGRSVPFLQYVVSLAVIEGIEAVCSSKVVKMPEVKIKWPNDLYAKGLKIGGVLCTSTYSSKKFNVVIGVGLNVANQHPTICLDTLLHELCSDPTTLTRHELLAAILGRFEVLFKVFLSQGFSALESKYYQRWLHSGQTVELEEREEGSSKVSKVYVRIQGLTATGYLRAVDDSDDPYELHPDGNSFDFLQGLVRKKM